MSQERMHPDDLRAIMAAQLALSSDDLTTGDVARGIEGADAIIAELTRTAKPEAEILPLAHVFKSNDGTVIAKLYGNASIVDRAESAEERADKAEATLRRLGYPEDVWKSMWEHVLDRAEKAERLLSESVRQLGEAEARANEMDNSLAIAESWRNDAALGLGEKRNRRIAELEQWQWDNMKKWLGIIGWGSMTPTQPECPTLIDAALQQGVEDAKRVDTLEARVKELEDAIKKHRSIVKGSHHWRGCDWDEELWSKVK